MANHQHRTAGISQLLALLFLLAVAMPGQAQTIYALSGSELIAFQAQTPGTLTSTVQITGITAGQTLAGLDFRPATGQLYALGYIPPPEKPACTPLTAAPAWQRPSALHPLRWPPTWAILVSISIPPWIVSA